MQTDDPPFELAYWHYGLSVAQEWRRRLGLKPDPQWQTVIDRLAHLPEAEGLYLPAARAIDAYSNNDRRRDHPIVTGVYGMLPRSAELDTAMLANTFLEIQQNWNWETTWGGYLEELFTQHNSGLFKMTSEKSNICRSWI